MTLCNSLPQLAYGTNLFPLITQPRNNTYGFGRILNKLVLYPLQHSWLRCLSSKQQILGSDPCSTYNSASPFTGVYFDTSFLAATNKRLVLTGNLARVCEPAKYQRNKLSFDVNCTTILFCVYSQWNLMCIHIHTHTHIYTHTLNSPENIQNKIVQLTQHFCVVNCTHTL